MSKEFLEVDISSKNVSLGKALVPFDFLESVKKIKNYTYCVWIRLNDGSELNLSFKKLDENKIIALKKSLKDKVDTYKKSHPGS